MEKTVNSVKQILDECNNMLSVAEDSEFMDVRGLAKTLRDELDGLYTLFDSDPGNSDAIQKKKAEVEHTAIRFEFLLRIRHSQYVDRYKLRKYAEKLYNDSRNKLLELSSQGVEKEIIGEWATRTNWALRFYNRSTHILFETDEEDDKKIKDIVEALS